MTERTGGIADTTGWSGTGRGGVGPCGDELGMRQCCGISDESDKGSCAARCSRLKRAVQGEGEGEGLGATARLSCHSVRDYVLLRPALLVA